MWWFKMNNGFEIDLFCPKHSVCSFYDYENTIKSKAKWKNCKKWIDTFNKTLRIMEMATIKNMHFNDQQFTAAFLEDLY